MSDNSALAQAAAHIAQLTADLNAERARTAALEADRDAAQKRAADAEARALAAEASAAKLQSGPSQADLDAMTHRATAAEAEVGRWKDIADSRAAKIEALAAAKPAPVVDGIDKAALDDLNRQLDDMRTRAEKAEAYGVALAAKFDALAGEPVSPGIRRRASYTYLTDDNKEHETHADAAWHTAHLAFAAARDARAAGGFVPRDKSLDVAVALKHASEPKPQN